MIRERRTGSRETIALVRRAPGAILRVSVLSRSTWFVASPALFLFALIPVSPIFWQPGRSALPWVLFGPAMGLLVLLLAREALTHFEVGRDGVLLRRRGKGRFVPFSRLESIEDRGSDLRFVLASGEELIVRTGKEERMGKQRYVAQCDALVSRIREGIERTRGGEDREVDADARVLLAHAQRALGRTGDDAQSYRTQALPPIETLWRVVDDPGADQTARAAAAVALRREPEARARLRVRADETASPPLRRLLRVAADDETDVVVARALDACARRDVR